MDGMAWTAHQVVCMIVNLALLLWRHFLPLGVYLSLGSISCSGDEVKILLDFHIPQCVIHILLKCYNSCLPIFEHWSPVRRVAVAGVHESNLDSEVRGGEQQGQLQSKDAWFVVSQKRSRLSPRIKSDLFLEFVFIFASGN